MKVNPTQSIQDVSSSDDTDDLPPETEVVVWAPEPAPNAAYRINNPLDYADVLPEEVVTELEGYENPVDRNIRIEPGDELPLALARDMMSQQRTVIALDEHGGIVYRGNRASQRALERHQRGEGATLDGDTGN